MSGPSAYQNNVLVEHHILTASACATHSSISADAVPQTLCLFGVKISKDLSKNLTTNTFEKQREEDE